VLLVGAALNAVLAGRSADTEGVEWDGTTAPDDPGDDGRGRQPSRCTRRQGGAVGAAPAAGPTHRFGSLFGAGPEPDGMSDDEGEDHEHEAEGDEGDDEKSFRERVEEIRQQRADESDGEGDEDRRERMEEMMGGGGPGGGGMGGNPFAQMMGGMMGGGGPGGGAMGGGPGGPGGEADNEELVREVRQLRDEVRDVNRTLEDIVEAIGDLD